MSISTFQLLKHRRAVSLWKSRAVQALILELNNELVAYAVQQAQAHRSEIRRLNLRSMDNQKIQFNLNSTFEQQSIEKYRFMKADSVCIASMAEWARVTTRNGYHCDPLNSILFFLHKLGTCVRWVELEEKYG